MLLLNRNINKLLKCYPIESFKKIVEIKKLQEWMRIIMDNFDPPDI